MTNNLSTNSLLQCDFISDGIRCPYKKSANSNYCSMHNSKALSNTLAGALRYKLKSSERVQELKDGPNTKNLYDEIALLRYLLESVWQQIEKQMDEGNEHAFLQNHSKITDIIDRIDKLITNTHKIEKSLGHLLDQSQLYDVIEQVITVIETELHDLPERCKAISTGIQGIVIKPFNHEDEL